MGRLGDSVERLAPAARDRMAANAEVFFDLEVPALVHTAPDAATVALVLDTAGVPVTVMADPVGTAAAIRAALR